MMRRPRRYDGSTGPSPRRIGALNDRFLGRDRPIGEARLLWEVGHAGQDVRRLRARLGLDSGYLSRLLGSLRAAGLVTVEPGQSDKRVRTVALTEAGLAERAVLDRRSDELAASLLEPLGEAQRRRLVEAMADVERLLTAAMVTIDVVDPENADARHCLESYVAELGRLFVGGFDPALSIPAAPSDLRPPAGFLVVARLHSEPIGCGALKFGRDHAEVKRMWVDESARGLGLGRTLLRRLEKVAADRGAGVVRLETNRALTAAVGLYRAAGYSEVAAFNDEPYADHWFEKRIAHERSPGAVP